MAITLERIVNAFKPSHDFDSLDPERDARTGKIEYIKGYQLKRLFKSYKGVKHASRGALYALPVGILCNLVSGDPAFQDIGWWMLDGAAVDSAMTVLRANYYYWKRHQYK